MHKYISDHAYFFAQILTCLLFLIFLLFIRNQSTRISMVFSGCVGICASIMALFYETDYWSPLRLIEAPWGLEDTLFSFVSAGIVWFLALIPIRGRTIGFRKHGETVLRFHLVGLPTLGVGILFHQIGVHSITGFIVSCLVLTLIVLSAQRELWPVAVSGALLYPPFHIALVKIHFLLWPDYVQYWHLGHFWQDTRILGIPLGEYAWSAGFGMAWPLFIAYLLKTDFKRKDLV